MIETNKNIHNVVNNNNNGIRDCFTNARNDNVIAFIAFVLLYESNVLIIELYKFDNPPGF